MIIGGKKKKKHFLSNKGGFLKGLGIFFIIILILLGLALGAGYAFLTNKLSNMDYMEIDESSIEVNSGVDESLKNYRNIALFGVDSRDNSFSNTRSDCIIIVSINKKTNDVKLTSVYRDTYVNIDGHGLDKITHAYAYGGPKLAMSTLNKNLDLNITEFITVNFETVKTVVDSIGGVRIKVTDAESTQISGLSSGGTYTLDGAQALAYSRIRKIDSDYQRTERMRTVIEAVFTKVKSLGVSELSDFVDTILPLISTNLSSNEIISMIPSVPFYNIKDSEGWPYDVQGYSSDAWYGVPVTLESNVKELHSKLFGNDNYTPTDTVQEISDDIINETGYSR